MEKYQKYTGVIISIIVIVLAIFIAINKFVLTSFSAKENAENELRKNRETLEKLTKQVERIKKKKEQTKIEFKTVHKKIYSPQYASTENDRLFFTLYNDIIDLLKENSVKIKKVSYDYNPSNDHFVELGENKYFVCKINFELISNYINFGAFIEKVLQYPYYIKLNSIKIEPYQKDKKILIIELSLNIYSKLEPETEPLLEE